MPDQRIRICNRPGCMVIIKPGMLACRDHWFELPPKLRERLVDAWEARKAHPDVPELVSVHRALLLEALRAWRIPPEVVAEAIKQAPRAMSMSCPWCGGVGGMHHEGCNRPGAN